MNSPRWVAVPLAILFTTGCPQSQTPPAPSTGRLPPNVVRDILEPHSRQALNCYPGNQKDDVATIVVVHFVINRDGTVSDLHDSDSNAPDPSVRACILNAFRNLSFPPPEGGAIPLHIGLKFNPGSEPSWAIVSGTVSTRAASEGEFDRRAAFEATVRAAKEAVTCSAPSEPHRVVFIAVQYATDGRVRDVQIEKSEPEATPEIERCIQDAFRKSVVPAFKGMPVTVHRRFAWE